MISINGKKLCKHCFKEVQNGKCTHCSSASNSAKYPTALNEGEILAGRYVVGKVLGKGGFGITYLCYDSKEQRRVAVKEYLPDSFTHRNKGETMVSTYGGESEEFFKVGVKNFYEEAKMVSRFNGNPNIISVYEFFFENNTTYFVMEYLDGIDLKKYISDSGGKIPESEALYVAMKISEALMIVHGTGVLHRDISPDNIFICRDGNVKLIDFGAARQVVGEASKSLSVILKQGFAPLEQYQKKGRQGPWTDIYALGATLYYAMTGEVVDDAMSRINDDEIEPKGISYEFLNVLRKMLAVKIEDRCQSTFELKERLNSLSIGMKKIEIPEDEPQVIPGKPIAPVIPAPKPEPKPAKPKKKSTKKIAIAAVAAVCVVTIIMGIVLSGFVGSGQDRITFTIGSYPQSIVTDQNLKNQLNQYLDKKIWYTYDYYSGDGNYNSIAKNENMLYADVTYGGEKYRGVVILKYRPESTELKPTAANSYQDDNGYEENTCYWFKYEPLKWRVLDKEEGLLICENIIDAQPYRSVVYVSDNETDETTYADKACTVVANCSTDTPIYTWLNNEFRNIAFSDSEMEMLVHNAKLTLYSEPVFLLTKKGATNENYGFPGEGKNDSFFNPEVSDYAKSQGLNTYKVSDESNKTLESADWLLAAEGWNMSSSHYYYAGNSIGVSQDWNTTSRGVRPAITVNPQYLEFIN